MIKIQTLATLRQGQEGRVLSLENTGSIRRRLLDLGLIEGTAVICLGSSPGGGMRAYRIRGAVIALRKGDSEKVLIEGVEMDDE